MFATSSNAAQALNSVTPHEINIASSDFGNLTELCKRSNERDVRILCNSEFVVYNVVVPISLAVGFPGNAAILMTVRSLPTSPSIVCIAIMTVGDLTVLIIKSVAQTTIMIDETFYEEIDVGNWFSNVYVFSGLYPNWMLVIICFERLCAVRFPLLKRRLFTITTAKMSGVILFFAVATVCMIACLNFPFLAPPWVAIYLSSVLILPFLCVMVCSVWIIITLARYRKKRLALSISGTVTPGLTGKTEHCLTVMMVAAAFSFLFLTSPTFVSYILDMLKPQWKPYQLLKNLVLARVSIVAVNLTHSVNCYMYFITARKFRRQLMKLTVHRSQSSTQV